MVSLDGLVSHFVAAGIVQPRADDALPFDQPLAPEAPKPNPVPLSDVVAQLPTFPASERLAGR